MLVLKDDQPNLAADVALLLQNAHRGGLGAPQTGEAQGTEKGHGRIETRTCTTIADRAVLARLCRSEE
jgi:hypothetical protein